MPLSIKMKNLGKVYKMGKNEYRALSDINLEISKGEFVSIVGPSGAGKSTLMNIIGCLDNASEGEYLLDGVNTNCSDNKLAEIRNKKIGFIFQNYNLLPKLNVRENVELPLIYQGVGSSEIRSKSMEVIKKVGLEEHINHKPSELSGGQKQRVAIARALASNPEIILADEPTGALDSKTGIEVIEMIKKINEEGNTIILITHDMNIAKEAKRIVTVRDGRIISDEKNTQEGRK
ncbi:MULTISPECIES: ABC transporter ATP-binding protein [Clostridium]|uniref:ABC transporter ATP-binding protein n=1 Tax=Clostridium TaxID=1485 RepID=UPI000824602C|nr:MULTISPECIES: ABC transporter ATP-binding protein [Clostridium]PJI10337.1 ABC transporter ATP-binding protein [Clostridium sp. CT7]